MPHLFETQPIEVERFYTGVISQRNKLAIPIRIMGRRIIELYDAILSGNDLEITVRSTLQRRAGYLQYNPNTVSGVPQKFYPFQPTPAAGGTATILPIVDTTTGIYNLQPTSGTPATIATKTQGKQSSFFGIGNYLYIGNTEFSYKWDGGTPQGLTKWGIAIGSMNNAIGPTLAGAGTSVGGGTQPAWTNPNNVTSATNFAYVSTFGTNTSQYLEATTFGFSIGAGNTITGIQVTFDHNEAWTGGFQCYVQMLKNGNPIGTAKTFAMNTQVTTLTLGSANDLWGTTWLPNDINQTGFGVCFYCGEVYGSGTFDVRNVKITINGLGGPTVTVLSGSGSMTATQGYQYVLAYGNSVDGNISNPTPASATTGPFSNVPGVQVSLTASGDAQVNQIHVFRTTDTGTGAVFFELPTSPYPNTTANITDTAADTALVVSSAVTVGTLAFSPPPAGLQLMEWYAGRLWGAVGNLLYFSAGPDNYPMGNGNSNWPPGNVFALPTTIVKLLPLSGGNGMLVVTLDKIHIVQGITNPGFTVNVWSMDIGARQQNAVDSDGSNIYLFSSDRQFLQITASGTNELSQYVSDTTDNFDPTLVYVCQHRSGSQDSRVFLSDGSARIYPYNLMSACWEPLQTPQDGGGVGAIGSIEIQPGIYKFLKGATSAGQLILQRDQNTFTDNGATYAPSVIFGNIPLCNPTQLANVSDIVLRYTLQGSTPLVGVLPDELSGNFYMLTNPVAEPPEASLPAASYNAMRWSLTTGPNLWTQMTHCQVQIQWINENAQNELLSWGIFPNESADQQVGKIPEIQGR